MTRPGIVLTIVSENICWFLKLPVQGQKAEKNFLRIFVGFSNWMYKVEKDKKLFVSLSLNIVYNVHCTLYIVQGQKGEIEFCCWEFCFSNWLFSVQGLKEEKNLLRIAVGISNWLQKVKRRRNFFLRILVGFSNRIRFSYCISSDYLKRLWTSSSVRKELSYK